jgi:hypothetical protein
MNRFDSVDSNGAPAFIVNELNLRRGRALLQDVAGVLRRRTK